MGYLCAFAVIDPRAAAIRTMIDYASPRHCLVLILGGAGSRPARHTMLLPMAVALAVGLVSAVAGQTADMPSDTQAVRRTRVVEVFENWKDSVVFVTGPIVKADKGSAAEFFAASREPLKERSVGTGFVIHESGYVVTNAHGVEKILAHVVVLADGKSYPAEPVAVMHQQDLALLKVVGARPLKAVRLVRDGELMIGETVIVIAHPHGLLHTCTAGVLSAMGRTSHLADVPGVTLQNLIQSDAGINPGSSGGPWFNAAGEVMGMTASMKKEAENIAFAISAATLRKLLPGMLDIERRYGFACGLEVTHEGRCEITGVRLDSPGAKAGWRAGDVITRLAEQPIATGLDFHLALLGRKPKDVLAVELLRQGKPEKASLVLAPRPKSDAKAVLKEKLGLEAASLDPAKAKAMALRVPRGLVVTAVHAGHYQAVEHRPQPGDVLARINFIRPRDLEHAALLVENLKPGEAADIVFVRRQQNVATRLDIHLVLPK